MVSQGYIIDSQICLGALYLLYIVFLHRRISHRAARAYLVIMLPLALVLPMLNLPLLPAQELVPMNFDMTTYDMDTTIVAAEEPTNYTLIAYLVGVAIMLAWIAIGAIRLTITLKRSRPERIQGLKVIFAQQKTSAYSVFNYIFINAALRRSELLNELLAHEECHIRLRHTIDLIYMSLMRSILWFNPAIWHTGSLLRQVHEFQVDQDVINQGHSTQNYINLLIMTEAGINPEFASPLSYKLTKKRLIMLAKQQKPAGHKRLLLTIPVIIMLICAFFLTTRAASGSETFSQQKINVQKELDGALVIINGKENTVEIMKALNPNSIKSINILKDAQSTKKYGKKGKNGVIEITLKQGFEIEEAQALAAAEEEAKAMPESLAKTIDLNWLKGSVSKTLPPLIVIDGVESAISPKEMQNSDVKSITVLKGESATSLFGEKGKNGAIIITTKDSPDEVCTPNNDTYSTSSIYFVVKNADGTTKLSGNGKEIVENLDPKTISSIDKIRGDVSKIGYGDHGQDGVIVITLKDASDDALAAKALSVTVQKQDGKKTEPRNYAEVMPEFPGGTAAMNNFLAKNISYPEEAVKQDIQGRVIIKFVVTKDGSINNVTVVHKIHPSLDIESVRLVASMPKWIPGEQDGEKVDVYFQLPITFKLEQRNTEPQNGSFPNNKRNRY